MSPTLSKINPQSDSFSKHDEIVLGPYDEFVSIEPNGDSYKDATVLDSFKNVPAVEFIGPLLSVAEMIKSRIFLMDFTPEHWTEQHTEFINKDFVPVGNVDVIFCSMRLNSGLKLESNFPMNVFKDINYFIRTKEGLGEVITSENFFRTVQHGSIIGQGIESLMRIMVTIYAPTFFKNTTWPDSIKNDFALQLHRFMSALTDTRFKLSFKTVLYIPDEAMDISPSTSSMDKDLVNRLEMIVIHWTRQIKEVLGSQSTMDDDEATGPLEEIEYWKNRCEDLTGISLQLDNKRIVRVTKILTLAKSSYVTAFIRLAEEIKYTSAEAQDNLKFLNTMKEMCTTLTDLPPSEIPPILARIINQIRMIWINSSNYNSKEAVTGLFRKVSNEIIMRCCSVISLDDIFVGRVKSASLRLEDCITCCQKYKEIYNHVAEMHSLFSKKPWDAEERSVFAQIDAFIQRCKDLQEVKIRCFVIKIGFSFLAFYI